MGRELFSPEPDGSIGVHLASDERALLAKLPTELRNLLVDDDMSTYRLFPPAYDNDAARNDEYHSLMHSDLVKLRIERIGVFEDTVTATTLSREQAECWQGVFVDLRLVIATKLDIETEADGDNVDPDDPDAALYLVYDFLSWLLDGLTRALAAGLPDEGLPGADSLAPEM